MTEEERKQRILIEKINLTSSLIESSRTSSGNMILSNKWVIDNLFGGKNILRISKIKKILDDKAGEI